MIPRLDSSNIFTGRGKSWRVTGFAIWGPYCDSRREAIVQWLRVNAAMWRHLSTDERVKLGAAFLGLCMMGLMIGLLAFHTVKRMLS